MAGKVIVAVVVAVVVAFGTGTVAGCASYQPGSFALPDRPFAGSRATLGCLELAIERRADQGSAAVLDYQFGNRCAQHTKIDLAHVRVIGRARDGREEQLAPYDPDLALRPLWLGGRRAGHEALAYPSARPHVEVCVELASLTGVGASSGPRAQPVPERWQCFPRVETGAPGEAPADDAAVPGQHTTTASRTAAGEETP